MGLGMAEDVSRGQVHRKSSRSRKEWPKDTGQPYEAWRSGPKDETPYGIG